MCQSTKKLCAVASGGLHRHQPNNRLARTRNAHVFPAQCTVYQFRELGCGIFDIERCCHGIQLPHFSQNITTESAPMLTIDNLTVDVAGTTILKGLSLHVPAGEVHAIMGPNGAGKSTLSYALTGRAGYEVTGGGATLAGEDLLALEPEARAAKGLFLSFQYPLEIPGVPTLTFLRTALNCQRKARGEAEMSVPEFMKVSRAVATQLGVTPDMMKRPLNVGFSGGEKKRMEIFQMALLSPRFMILDETDSGLDIDALKVVAEGVNALRGPDRAMLVITHYQRLLDHIKPDRVHVLAGGKIVDSGGPELALALEAGGYEAYKDAA